MKEDSEVKPIPSITMKVTQGNWTSIRWITVPAKRGPKRLLVIRCACGVESRAEPCDWVRNKLPAFCRQCLIEREKAKIGRQFFGKKTAD